MLGSIQLVSPPLKEQQTIADLDAFCKKLTDATILSQIAIGSLQDFRSALITAAVTGQIDVRNVVC